MKPLHMPLVGRAPAPAIAPSLPRWRRKAAVVAAAALLGLVGAAGAWLLFRPRPLDTVHPRVGQAIAAVYASGTVEASVMLPISPRVGGRLVSLASDEHSLVRKGQVLARLEDTDVANTITQLQAAAEFARGEMERSTRLWVLNAIARQSYDRAMTNWKAAEAAVRQARAQREYMTLRSPQTCEVIQRDGEVGQYVAANSPIFWLSCQARLRISALVDEEDVAQVRVGQPVLIRADAFPGRIFRATVTEITPKGDPVSRAYRIRIMLPADTPLRIGMTTESNILVRRNDHALLVPASAVSDGQVWKIEQGLSRHVRVVSGVRSGDWIEIRAGLAAGDLVLRDGAAAPPGRPRLRIAP